MKAPTTLKPKRLYRWLTWHPSLEKAVQALSTQQLRILNGHLGLAGATNGIPGLIHGLILHEAAGRLMIRKDAKDQ